MRVAVTFKTLRDANPRKLQPYVDALAMAGLDAVCLTPDRPGEIDGFRGLVLTGGADINPSRYGHAMNGSEGVDDDRDQLEFDLLRAALDRDLPVLAICRGVQLLNVFHGGALIQDLPGKDHNKRSTEWPPGRHPAAHNVNVDPESRLAAIIGPGEHEVNSRHHQAATQVGSGLVVSVRSSHDGVIEGLEHPEHSFVVGVQWHPEDRVLVSDADRKLFAAFAAAVR
jgi:gamma-glutamyl-gamma-aminobutyrate hydrolase PuuD